MSLRLSCLLALAASGSLHAATFTADQLIAKNLEARGGADKLRAITTQHVVGIQHLGGGLEAKTESWAIAPGHWRDEFSLQGLTAVEAWDGTQAWAINPFEGRRDPQKLSPDDAKDMIEAADIAGPLLDYKAKGSKVEYLGTEDIDGTDAHKLRVTFKNGDSWVVYLDPDQFLEIRIVTHHMIRGQERVTTTDVGEYEKVDGLYFPFEIGHGQIETMTLNPSIDAGKFTFPVAASSDTGAHK
jgi:outer membrane lipoprotein-sorting protein